jgi:hypothetical protein
MRPLQPSEFRLDPCGKYASDIEGVRKPPLGLEIQAIRRALWNGGRWESAKRYVGAQFKIELCYAIRCLFLRGFLKRRDLEIWLIGAAQSGIMCGLSTKGEPPWRA